MKWMLLLVFVVIGIGTLMGTTATPVLSFDVIAATATGAVHQLPATHAMRGLPWRTIEVTSLVSVSTTMYVAIRAFDLVRAQR